MNNILLLSPKMMIRLIVPDCFSAPDESMINKLSWFSKGQKYNFKYILSIPIYGDIAVRLKRKDTKEIRHEGHEENYKGSKGIIGMCNYLFNC